MTAGDNGVFKLNKCVGAVPSLRLLATMQSGPDAWSLVTVKTCMELVWTMMELDKTLRSNDSFRLLRKFLEIGALLGTSRLAFETKVRAFGALIKNLEDSVSETHRERVEEVNEKIEGILRLHFYDCSPWRKSVNNRSCILVMDREEGDSRFVCCHCPQSDCDAECFLRDDCSEGESAVDEVVSDLDISASLLAADADRFAPPDLSARPKRAGSPPAVASTHCLGVDTNCSFYSMTSPHLGGNGGLVTFDFISSDFEASLNLLLSLNDPANWTVKKENNELKLSKNGTSVKAAVHKNNGRVMCKFEGPGLSLFCEDILPGVLKLTSCKLIEEKDEVCKDDDDPIAQVRVEDVGSAEMVAFAISSFTSSPATSVDTDEMVFAEEASTPSSTDAKVLSGTAALVAPKITPRTVAKSSGGEYECKCCGRKFKYPSSLAKHKSACGFADIPQDILAHPKLEDGRKPCPGCNRRFAGHNVSFLKHLRACSKVKFGAFSCKTCLAKFSTKRTLDNHAKVCSKYRKRKQPVTLPKLTKKIKIESVMSLQTAEPPAMVMPRPKPKVSYVSTTEKYGVVCKSGHYVCPLCNSNFRLNQPYGRHVKSQECLKKKSGVKPPTWPTFAMRYITIYPGVKGLDTVIAHNRVMRL